MQDRGRRSLKLWDLGGEAERGEFELPQDLVEGYGYPQLTDQAKRKILGENLLRLHGMDVDDAKKELGRR